MLEWMFWEQYSHEPNVATVRHWVKHIGVPEEKRAIFEQKRSLGVRALSVMEKHLARHRFFAANRYTIADIALYAYTHVAHESEFDLSTFPAVRAWLKRVAGQPNYVPMDWSPATAAAE